MHHDTPSEYHVKRQLRREASSASIWPSSRSSCQAAFEHDLEKYHKKLQKKKQKLAEEMEREQEREREREKEREREREREKQLHSANVNPEAELEKRTTVTPSVTTLKSTLVDQKTNESSTIDSELRFIELDEPCGPQPLPMQEDDQTSYGGQLMPGEGSAIAAYIQSGKRIPRRGEIGLSSEDIEVFENSGYVMSGSRHARMNAVRLRKENQVLSAEEKRNLARLHLEERTKRDNQVIADFKDMIQQKLKKSDAL